MTLPIRVPLPTSSTPIIVLLTRMSDYQNIKLYLTICDLSYKSIVFTVDGTTGSMYNPINVLYTVSLI